MAQGVGGPMTTRKRERRMSLLLEHLDRHADADLSASAIGDITGLGDGVLPLLADLAREGLVEHSWQDMDGRRRLCYRITQAGREAGRASRS